MPSKESGIFVGKLAIIRLFENSKSERSYLVLDCVNGQRYRIRIVGATMLGEDSGIMALVGKTVEISGAIDDLRGHWRLSVHATDIRAVVLRNDAKKETVNSTTGRNLDSEDITPLHDGDGA